MSPQRGLWIVACLLVSASLARADDSGRIALLQEWQESPLDLLRADVADLAMLPGLDADLAEAVVGLRALGELGSIDDLARVPGIGAARVELIRPYARVGTAGRHYEARWQMVGQDRAGAPARWRHGLKGGTGPLRLDLIVVDDGQPWWRGAASARLDRVEVFAGHLVLRGSGSMFAGTSIRSRLAAAALPRPTLVRTRTDSGSDAGWKGAAIRGPDGNLFLGRSPSGDLTLAASGAAVWRSLRGLAAIRVGDGPAAMSVHVSREIPNALSWCAVTVEGTSRHAWMGVRARGQLWRAGLDASSTDGALRRGVDEVTGNRLDRAHRVLQLHGRIRGSGWSVGAIWRDLRRGHPGAVVVYPAAEFDVVWRSAARPGPDRLELRIRVLPVRRATVSAWFPQGRHEVRARFSREIDGNASGDLAGFEYRYRSNPYEFRATLAGVDGNASRAWMVSRPGTGIYPVWMRPPGLVLATGCRRGSELFRLGVWSWLRMDAGRAPDHGIGATVSVRAGQVVQRLQGAGDRGSGAFRLVPPIRTRSTSR